MRGRGATPAHRHGADAGGVSRSAASIVPLLRSIIDPFASGVDVGCGLGAWCEAMRAAGVERTLGIDQTDPPPMASPYLRVDLSAPIVLPERFDVALCLEVAEHLDERAASTIVGSLVGLAPVVVFSAAIPGQAGLGLEGPGHVNERWPTYWLGRFAAHGYEAVDCLRHAVWTDDRVSYWYRQNLLVFVEHDQRHRVTGEERPPIDLVHPELLARYREAPSVPVAARLLTDAVRRSLRSRRRQLQRRWR